MDERWKIAIAFFLCGLAASLFISTAAYRMGWDAGIEYQKNINQSLDTYDWLSGNLTIIQDCQNKSSISNYSNQYDRINR